MSSVMKAMFSFGSAEEEVVATDAVTARTWTAPSAAWATMAWATTAAVTAKVAESACSLAVNVL